MTLRKDHSRILLVVAFAVGIFTTAYALSMYVDTFKATYPTASATLATCALCHTNINTSTARNPYGSAFANAGHNYKAIESQDSDGDGFTNIEEITAGTFPGDASSHPADKTPPTVTSFTIPATSSSLIVPITQCLATDNVGVTGYMVTESASAPAAGAAGWTASPPANYTFTTAGAKTLFAWAKDAAGNVSAGRSAITAITLPPVEDKVPPTVTAFNLPAASSTLTVSITLLAATDNVGVTGYMVTESAAAPAANASNWMSSPPSSYIFTTAGAKILYAWAKDAAGNVSAGRSATTTITISPPSDKVPPTITVFNVPATASSLTVPITSLTATDNIGVTGYVVTESASAPAAGAAGWTALAPTGFKVSASGQRTLYAWAKDAAGNISAGKSASVTVTLKDPLSPDMSIWVGRWFAVGINRKGGDDPNEIGYLKILSWNSNQAIFQTSLYMWNGATREWLAADLPFHYTSGSVSRFLFWFDYAGEYEFAAGMLAVIDNKRLLQKATFNAAGIYLFKSEDEEDEHLHISLTLRGKWIPDYKVPPELLAK